MQELAGKRAFVAGHKGMVGSAIVRRLAAAGCEVITADRSAVDLRSQSAVSAWMAQHRPEHVYIAAAKVGGILANSRYPADFLYDNLVIATNLIQASHEVRAEKLLFLGSSCIYPKHAAQPIGENQLLAGPLEPTNEWYAIAKIAGIKLCQAYRRQYGSDFISAMPTNLYGPGDNYDLNTSHVLPALLRKAHDVKIGRSGQFVVWGTGKVLREFLHADDCADACLFLMQHYSGEEHVNVGSGVEISITDLAVLVCRVVGITPDIQFDSSKPEGTPRKLMNSAKLNELGWSPSIPLEQGVRQVYQDLLADPSW